MTNVKKQVACLALFALCILMASNKAVGHFSLGREIKQPVGQGPAVVPERNFERESYLQKNQQMPGRVNFPSSIFTYYFTSWIES